MTAAAVRSLAPDTAQATADTLTVLRTVDGHIATKTVRAAETSGVDVIPYNAGARFTPSPVGVSDIRSLGDALARISADPRAFVIRGALGPNRKPSSEDGTVWRRKAEGAWRGYFVDVPRRWVCIDVDHIRMPKGMSQIQDPEGVVRHALAHLGAPWWTTTVYWQASSSAGLPGVEKIKVHLWFWLDQPIDNRRLRAKFRQMNKAAGYKVVDEALADSIQIHFTAAPVFQGMADPLPRRQGLLLGESDVVTVELLRLPSAPLPRRRKGQPAADIQAIPTDTPEVPTPASTISVQRKPRTGKPPRALDVASPPVSTEPPVPSSSDSVGAVIRLYPKTGLYCTILDDVLTLARLRYGAGGVADGERDTFLFAAAVAAANVNPARVATAANELASILVPGKPEDWVEQKLSALTARVSRHLSGERVPRGGKATSPIYSPSIQWFVETLSITPREMEHLAKLISPAVRRRRSRQRASRAAWSDDCEYLTRSQADYAAVLYLRRCLSAKAIADIMHVSERRVWQFLKVAYP